MFPSFHEAFSSKNKYGILLVHEQLKALKNILFSWCSSQLSFTCYQQNLFSLKINYSASFYRVISDSAMWFLAVLNQVSN